MIVAFHGVRGSTPAPGPAFAAVGGHTSCVSVRHAGESAPRLVFDAGTGLRALSVSLAGSAFRGTILLGHLHWDHTQGIPFFPAGDRPDARVTVLGPAQPDGSSLLDVLERMVSPPLFPITPTQLRGEWRFDAIGPGRFECEGFGVLALEIPHKGGTTYGYRVSDADTSVAYLSDHMPQAIGGGTRGVGEVHDAARALCEGADLLVHDAQYTEEELPVRGAFGHAAAEYAVELAETVGARSVALFHHDPARTDVEVEEIAASVRSGATVDVIVAREGVEIDLARR